MKLDKILDTATKTFVKMKLGGKKTDPGISPRAIETPHIPRA